MTPTFLAALFSLGLFLFSGCCPCLGATGAADVPASAEATSALRVGAEVPAVTLKTVDGQPFDLKLAAEEKPLVVVFYRGGWCKYCNTQLKQL